MSSDTKTIPVKFAGWKKRKAIPKWAQNFNAWNVSVPKMAKYPDLSGVIVIEAENKAQFQRHRTGLKPLFNRLQNSRNPYKLVVNLSNDESLDADALSDFLRKIPFSVSTHTEITMGEEHLRHSVAQAVAKCRLQAEEQNRDPLAKARQVIRKRLPLLSGNGRLSAQAVAKTFGLSLSQLAVQIGRTKQALSKTPDSPRIQSLLRPYERIARLRAVFSDSNFKAWLEQPNSQLDDHSPMELVNTGRADVAADLVEDMLLGNPG